MNTQGYITSLIAPLFHTISLQINELEKTEVKRPNEVQTGIVENGLSCGIVVLSVIALESTLNRIRNVRGDTNDKRADGYLENTNYIKLLLGAEEIPLETEELFAIRDAIVHNHLWQASITWSAKEYTLSFAGEPKLLDGYGNKRMRKVMTDETRKTRRLGLNLFPTRIWRRDAYIVFKRVVEMLKQLEDLDRNYIYFTHFPFKFGSEYISLWQIASLLQIPIDSN